MSKLWLWLEQTAQDLRYAARSLARAPGFALTAGLTIALGVGANAAIFSLVDAVMIASVPVRNPEELVFVRRAMNAANSNSPIYPCLAKLPTDTQSLESIAVFAGDELRIEIDGRPEPVMGQLVSGNYFEVLGVRPAHSRLISADDEVFDSQVAVISDRYWRRRFGGDPSAIGKPVSFRNQTFTIVGVTPPEFSGLDSGRPFDIALPIWGQLDQLATARNWWFSAVARLSPDSSIEKAKAESNALFSACTGSSLDLLSAAQGTEGLRGRFSGPLYISMGIVALVLLMATVNVANLLLSRSIVRGREFAIRLATGAARSRLVRQLLTENLMLFGLGAIPGVFFASFGINAIASMFAEGRRPLIVDASLNWRVLSFSIAITLGASLISGLVPALRAFRTDADRMVSEGQHRIGESRRSAALTRGIVAFQVALSFVLLVVALTFVGTLSNLHREERGFGNEEVLTMSIELPDGYVQSDRSIDSWAGVLDAVRSVQGVQLAGLATLTPLSGRDPGETPVRIAGLEPSPRGSGSARVNQVSEGYFETLGVSLSRGRLFTAEDREGMRKVALVNEAAARRYFSSRNPIGESLTFDAGGGESVYAIVGVVEDTKHRSLREPTPPFVFLPTRQPLVPQGRVTLAVASKVEQPERLLEPIRRQLAVTDPRLMISEVITLQNQLDSTLLMERLLSGLSAAFGTLALILAAVGLFGVLSFRIRQEQRSIGIRIALGAQRYSVALRVLRQSGLLVLFGLAAGLPIAVATMRLASSLLWGLEPNDYWIYVAASSILALVALVTAYLPAKRAAAVQPAEALRNE